MHLRRLSLRHHGLERHGAHGIVANIGQPLQRPYARRVEVAADPSTTCPNRPAMNHRRALGGPTGGQGNPGAVGGPFKSFIDHYPIVPEPQALLPGMAIGRFEKKPKT